MVLDRSVLFGVSLESAALLGIWTVCGSVHLFLAPLVGGGWSSFPWRTPGKCVQHGSALQVNGRTAGGLGCGCVCFHPGAPGRVM